MLFPSRQQQRQFPYSGQRQMRKSLPQNKLMPSKLITSSNKGGITKTLDSVQQILNMVQSTAPFIQEYGPMIKNLPAMYRMMKAFKDFEKEDETKVEEKEELQEQEIEIQKEKPVSSNPPVKPKKDGMSKPKLYI